MTLMFLMTLVTLMTLMTVRLMCPKESSPSFKESSLSNSLKRNNIIYLLTRVIRVITVITIIG